MIDKLTSEEKASLLKGLKLKRPSKLSQVLLMTLGIILQRFLDEEVSDLIDQKISEQ